MSDSLADLRRRRGWSQAHLAEQTGVHRSTVAAWESGRATPSRSNAETLEQLLGLPTAPSGDEEGAGLGDGSGVAPATVRRWSRGSQRPGHRSRQRMGLARRPPAAARLPASQPRLGEVLRSWRVDGCWSQADLAGKAGVHRSAVVAWESGRATPGWASRARLLAAFGLPADELAQPAWQ